MSNGSGRKLLASPALKLRIGAACIALLTLGAWLRPQTAAQLTPTEERPAPLLEEQVQQRAAPPFRGAEDAVARLPARGVGVRRDPARAGIASDFGAAITRAPAVFAVTVSESYVVTHVTALSAGRPPVIVTDSGAEFATSIAAFDMATGLVLLSSESPVGAIPVFADDAARPGELVIAAARTRTDDVAIPLFITTVSAERYGVGGFAEGPTPGLPIYNLDGGLLAVSAGDGTAWRIRHALGRLLSRAATASLPSAIGVAFQVVGEDLADAFGTNGLAIVDVAAGGPADAGGVEIGDVIVGVGTATSDNADLASALAALPSGTPARLLLRRGRRDIATTVTPALAHDLAAHTRQSTGAAGPLARTLFDADALTAAAVPGDAVVVMVDGRHMARATSTARETPPAKGAPLVLFERGGQRFFARVAANR